ncbi:uncharacterized LOC729966 homolog [Pelobates fuscus]|uniref:uncharacterized LOC729966 homolog n=1 Tax=Pelobates fuscus TaxID=191477 RepID=UPI002FE48D0C
MAKLSSGVSSRKGSGVGHLAEPKIHRLGVTVFAKQLPEYNSVSTMAFPSSLSSVLLLVLVTFQVSLQADTLAEVNTSPSSTVKPVSSSTKESSPSSLRTVKTVSSSTKESSPSSLRTVKTGTEMSTRPTSQAGSTGFYTSSHVDNTTHNTGSTQNISSGSTLASPHPSIFSTLQSGLTDTSNSSKTSSPVNGTNTEETQASKGLSDNPGLVAVICIFVSIVCITMVVFAVKLCQKKEPEFEKLNEVPMNGMNEEAPFARYPPK